MTYIDEPCDWAFCKAEGKWVPTNTLTVLEQIGTRVRFSCPYCETDSESEVVVGDRPTTVPDTFASAEAGEGASEEG